MGLSIYTLKLKANLISLLAAIIILNGCVQVANMIGYDSQTMNEEAARGYTEMINQARSEGKIEVNSPVAKRIKTVFQRMVPYADKANRTGIKFDWKLNVIRKDELNAFAMPGGKMVIYTGIVEKLNLNDDEIAAIIGHEMTHALQEHSKKAVGQQILSGLALEIGGAVVQSKTGIDAGAVDTYKDILNQFGLTLPYSRHNEAQADAGGLRLMAEAGYNPQAAVSVWEKMNQYEGSNSSISLLSTHPSNNARITALKKMLPEVMPIYAQSNHIRQTKLIISNEKSLVNKKAKHAISVSTKKNR